MSNNFSAHSFSSIGLRSATEKSSPDQNLNRVNNRQSNAFSLASSQFGGRFLNATDDNESVQFLGESNRDSVPESMGPEEFLSQASRIDSGDVTSETNRQGKNLEPFKNDLGNRFPESTRDPSQDFTKVNPLAMSLASSHKVMNYGDYDSDDY